ncbi:unannotated protein [freshwater metagenome]|uniref:Unannotated protein n=2 Tax=freshwater metagenome TaxID=449393 RepID=A0A6J6YX06_9ZZZZ|nr:uridine diphosphate-N-acetylglucosamine-binding protein YvcK [Actinomycetota bacterium]MSW62594.1 uridine diphosphate-N-acetylglucosamine-binding protein YvcK [Actinomycetota bacterium]MSX90196.1 uridine diphosphate-N-acetylglucosamine-binding protein YvcK [Actinomycetota bacterium]MSZ64705.1 uridine diphosphate-N-acetylglucosamine-binding protein YvcK [Actinomycetota bacterium]
MNKVVALGGGHGLAATLSALRQLTSEITAIVTVADNGGSSGRLREEFPIFPPGDLRMALAALCADDEWGRTWADILQHRFVSDGALNGHSMGNLLLASLWSQSEDPVAGLDRVGSLLKVIGRVLPMAAVPLDIEATFNTSTGRIVIRGQKEVATARGRIESLRVIPVEPAARIEALTAIRTADWITMGPGSWFSSVMPHLLVPMQLDGLSRTKAKKILIMNLDSHPNTVGEEYAGSTPEEHLELFAHYAPDVAIDYVLVDNSVVRNEKSLSAMAASLGGQVVAVDIRKAPGSIHHDVSQLALHLGHIMRQSLVG